MASREIEALCADPVYVLRLHQRVGAHIVGRTGPGGAPRLNHAFHVIDATHHGGFGADGLADQLVSDEMALAPLLRPVFPTSVLSDRDVAALAHLLFADDDDEGGGRDVDDDGERQGRRRTQQQQRGRGRSSQRPEQPPPVVALYMLQLRHMSPLVTFQLWDAVREARRVVQALGVMDDFEGCVLMVCNAEADGREVVPVLPEEAQEFLEAVCGASGSAAKLVTEACTVRSAVADTLDPGHFYDLVFADAIPPEVEFTLLARRFAESATTGVPLESAHTGASSSSSGACTGSLALCEAIKALRLPSPTSTDGRVSRQDEAMDFVGVPAHAPLTSRLFFRLCVTLGTGFQQEESDKLFFYVYNNEGRGEYDATRHPLLPVVAVLKMFRRHFPGVSLSTAHIIRCAVANLVGLSPAPEGTAFFRLYQRLAPFGSDRVPLAAYVQALRESGVAPSAVSDLQLEWLRLQGGTRVELLTALCVPPPAGREAVIAKLFERLLRDGEAMASPLEGSVHASDVLARFDPDKMEGKAAQALGQQWKAMLTAYYAELELDALSYQLFSFAWYLFSAAVADDAMFTMGIWQGFGLAERTGLKGRGAGATRR